jgi:hypothetical protein
MNDIAAFATYITLRLIQAFILVFALALLIDGFFL